MVVPVAVQFVDVFVNAGTWAFMVMYFGSTVAASTQDVLKLQGEGVARGDGLGVARQLHQAGKLLGVAGKSRRLGEDVVTADPGDQPSEDVVDVQRVVHQRISLGHQRAATARLAILDVDRLRGPHHHASDSSLLGIGNERALAVVGRISRGEVRKRRVSRTRVLFRRSGR